MLNLPTKLVTNAAGLFSGYNWYKAGAEILLVLGLIATVHFHAVYNCERKHDEAKVSEANAHAAAVVTAVAQRLPDVAHATSTSAKLRESARVTKEKLDEAIKAHPESGCNISDDELARLQELANKTHK